MTDLTDPSKHEVNAKVELTENGLELKIRSRTVSGLDRLGGNLLEMINTRLEGRNNKARALNEAEARAIEAASEKLTELIRQEDQMLKQVLEPHLKGVARKIINKFAVAQEALEELDRLPPPSEEDLADASSELDEDWLNHFEGYAEKMTSEGMRKLFGRILAGEIRKKSAFSYTTLRIASELNQHISQLFQSLASVRMLDAIPYDKDVISFTDGLRLEQAGLVSFSGGELIKQLQSNHKGVAVLRCDEVIAYLETVEPGDQIDISSILLTQAGLELAMIFQNNEVEAWRRIVPKIEGKLRYAALFRIVNANGSNIIYEKEPFEILKRRTT